MSFESLNLPNRSPDVNQQLNNLKMRDMHFAKLFEQYSEIDLQISRMENSAKDVDRIYIDGLRKHRTRITSQLLDMLYKTNN